MRLELRSRGLVLEDLDPGEVESLRRQLGGVEVGSAMLTTKEAAQRLAVSEEFVRRRAKELGGERVAGGPWRFPPDLSLPKVSPEAVAKPRRRKRAGERLLAIRGSAPYSVPNQKAARSGAVTPATGLTKGGNVSYG